MKSTVVRHLALTLAAAAVLLAVTYGLAPFRNYQLATVAAYLCATAGLTVLTGLSGQLSLGHGALMATGAYPVAFAQNEFRDRDITGAWVLPLCSVIVERNHRLHRRARRVGSSSGDIASQSLDVLEHPCFMPVLFGDPLVELDPHLPEPII